MDVLSTLGQLVALARTARSNFGFRVFVFDSPECNGPAQVSNPGACIHYIPCVLADAWVSCSLLEMRPRFERPSPCISP